MLLKAPKRLNKMSLWKKVGIFYVYLVYKNFGKKIGLKSPRKRKKNKEVRRQQLGQRPTGPWARQRAPSAIFLKKLKNLGVLVYSSIDFGSRMNFFN